MAVSVVAHFPELTTETYDEVIASLDLDANPPAGAILHVAGEADGSITTSEIWQTEQTFRAYLDYRLRPALRMHGVQREPVSRSRRSTTSTHPRSSRSSEWDPSRCPRTRPARRSSSARDAWAPGVCVPTGGVDTLVRVIAVAGTRRPEERAPHGR